MKKIYWILFATLCIFISIHPIKYFLTDEPILLLSSKTTALLASKFYNLSFYAHISLGGIALLIGWTQFIEQLRIKFSKVHRTIGKIYITSVLISGPFGFYIALHASGGLSPKLGFSVGAVLWTVFTFLGFMAIKKGNVERHRALLMYSYAGTFGAVTLRLWLPLLIAITGGFTSAYGIVAWLSWLPNLLIVYLVLHHKATLLTIYNRFYIKRMAMGILILTPIIFLLSFKSPQTWFYKSATSKGTPFTKSTSLDDSYFSADKLDELRSYLEDESETTSMLVLEDGAVVFEYGDVSEISYNGSCRKSILAMLYGKYVEQGIIDLDETIGALGIDEDDGLLPIEKKATIRHLISSSSGVFHPPANGGSDQANIKPRGSVQPGAYFVYNNWDFNVAGHIFEQKSGMSVYEALEEQLAVPLGFEDWNIQNQKRTFNEKKSRYSAYHMHLSTRDMAKIGQLMLQKGQWNGEQLVPQDWIRKITSTVIHQDTVSNRYQRDVSSPVIESYGYMWWLFERFYDNPDFDGAYTASGFGGQFITVIPKRNVVIVHKTKLDILTYTGLSERTKTPSWRYWWILRNLMLQRKSIASFAKGKSVDEMINFIREEYTKESEYAISERCINEYGRQLTDLGDCSSAIKFFELNLQLYPKGYYTHRTMDYLGHCLEELGRMEEAITVYTGSLKHHPNNSSTKKNLQRLKTIVQ